MSIFDAFKKKSRVEKPESKPEVKTKTEPKVEKKPVKKEILRKETPKKETPKKETPKKETPKKETPKKEIPEKEISEKETPKKKPVLKTTEAWQSLVSPHITEKATNLTSKNHYVFKVFKRANKNQIKRAVESLYNVEVNDVKIINVKPKKRKLGKIEGTKSGYKKAIVIIKKGQEIEILPR